jgi:hypothetical protein
VGVAVVASWALVELTSPGLYRGGFALVACASAVLVLAAIAGPRTAAALGWRPLAAVGDHSYAIYVLHLPIFLVLDPDRVGVDGPALLAVRLAVTAAVAVAVHAVVERPVHLGGALPGRVGRLGLATAFAAVAVFAVAMPRVDPTLDERDLGELLAIGGEGPTVLTAPSTTAPSAGVPASPADPAVVPADADLAPGDVAAPSATTAPGSAPTSVPPAPAPRLLVVGDSTALVNGAAMQEWGARTGRVEVDVVGAPACSFFQEGDIVYREGWQEAPSPACLNLLDRIEDVAADRRPDAVVLFIGSAQLADRVVPGTSTRTAMGDPAFDAAYDSAAGAALARLAALGPPVLWATVPTPAWVPEMTVPNTDLPGDGPVTMNDAGRAARLRELDAPLAAAYGIEVVPYAEHLTRPDGTVDPRLRPDGLHLAVDAVHEAMDTWLEAELRAAFNRAAGDADVRATRWTVPSG